MQSNTDEKRSGSPRMYATPFCCICSKSPPIVCCTILVNRTSLLMQSNCLCLDRRESFSLTWGHHYLSNSWGEASVNNQWNSHFCADGMKAFANGKSSLFVFIPQSLVGGQLLALVQKVSSEPSNKGNFLCINFDSFVTNTTARRHFQSQRANPFTTFSLDSLFLQ